MAQLDLPPEDPMLMGLLAVAAGPVAPIGDGPRIEAEGGDDGLDGAAVQRSAITRVTRSADSLSR